MQEITAKPRKRNVDKDSHAFRITHEAHLLLQALAREQGVEPSAFLEVISRQLASERLSQEQRERIKAQAQRITAERRQEAEQNHVQQHPL